MCLFIRNVYSRGFRALMDPFKKTFNSMAFRGIWGVFERWKINNAENKKKTKQNIQKPTDDCLSSIGNVIFRFENPIFRFQFIINECCEQTRNDNKLQCRQNKLSRFWSFCFEREFYSWIKTFTINDTWRSVNF